MAHSISPTVLLVQRPQISVVICASLILKPAVFTVTIRIIEVQCDDYTIDSTM